jgi:hypothetical protein
MYNILLKAEAQDEENGRISEATCSNLVQNIGYLS